ncbi:MAG TPA: hypothetical protein VGE83_10280 [Terracidiphilus sp.]|jgi:hypothetical protein
MRKAVRFILVCALLLLPGVSRAGERFDGKWLTTVTCPAKGKTEGYTWKFPSVVNTGNFRGEHGTAGEPGYLLIEGKIADDGTAKLSANGLVASRKYGTGIFTTQGSDYSYDIKAQFKETEGTGLRDKGLGIAGRPCTFDFVKQ